MRGRGETGHVQPGLGDDHLRVVFADTGDLVEALDGTQPRALGLNGGIDPTRRGAGESGCAPSWLRPGVGSLTRAGRGGVGVVAATVIDRGGHGQLGDQVLGPAGERVDLGAKSVDLGQQHPGQLGVVVVEARFSTSSASKSMLAARVCRSYGLFAG